MTQRYTLDRSSFEQFLAAASLLQQFQKRSSTEQADAQPLWNLIDLQRDIEAGRVDVNTVIQRVPQLACQLVGGSGAAVWLLTPDNEFTWRAGTGAAESDERLRLEVLSRLALFEDGRHDRRSASRNWDAGYYPGCAKSLLVEPIRQAQVIAGAIAVFATEFDAFTERDISRVQLVASMAGYALQRSSQAGAQQATALERTALREAIDRVIPQIQTLAQKQETERHRPSHIVRYQAKLAASKSPSGSDEPLFAAPIPRPEPPQPSLDTGVFASFPQADQPLPTETRDTAQPANSPAVADIYVPGIGVRAALAGDEPEPSPFWTNLRSGIGGILALLIAAFATLFGAVSDAFAVVGRSFASRTRAAGARIRIVGQYRPKLPSLPTESIRGGMTKAMARSRTGLARAGSQMRSAARHMPRPNLHAGAAHRAITSAGASTEKGLRAVGRALRDAPNVIPDLPPLPANRIAEKLNAACSSILAMLADVGTTVGKTALQLRIPSASSWNFDSRLVRRVAPAIVVLAVMVAFLFSEAGSHKTEVASASTTAVVTPAAAVLPAPTVTNAPTAASSPLANSPTHRQVTDSEIRSDIENMTRYEIATVRRAAQYGDDTAAFQLGMAYEIGYDVPQNCAKAAEWVTRAANAGNAAAQFNLGLRYRDGDGVAANPAEAENWLKKAAEHKYANAGSLLASLRKG
jgi:GAF domain-containing protein